MNMKRLGRGAALLLLLVLLAGCTALTGVVASEATTAPATAAAQPAATSATTAVVTTTAAPAPVTVRITAVGDILLHNTVSLACKTGERSFDFTPLFAQIKPYITGSDIAFANQEVMLTGEVYNYPRFAAPFEVADALEDAGFNVLNLATNHTMDQGEAGLAKCLEAVGQRDFEALLGAFESEAAAGTPILLEKQGITFGFLSYTYGLNGIAAPKDKPWMISVLSETDPEANTARITREVEALRPQCDYLIVSMHWGVEYTHKPTATQLSQAQLLCDLGVDLVIGHHPHVLQPLEWLESPDGHQMLCMYSLGNFVSNQQKYATMLGGLLDVQLTFDPQSKALLATDAGVAPLVTHYANRQYTTYFLKDYNDELARAHGIERAANPFSLEYLEGLAVQVLGDAMIPGGQ